MALLVQKYGGTSVADSTRIINVAKRIAAAAEAGNQVVSVVSAMGNTTDRLIELAHEITPEPSPRELDFLLSTGEIVSCTLLAMALRELGAKAISLSGAQAGIQTDASHSRARIEQVETRRVLGELEKGNIVIVAGFQGMTTEMETTTPGPRRLRHYRRRPRSRPQGRALRNIHRRTRRLHSRPARRPQRPQTGGPQLRGDARAGQLRRRRAPPPVGGARGILRHTYPGRFQLQQRAGHTDPRRRAHGIKKQTERNSP